MIQDNSATVPVWNTLDASQRRGIIAVLASFRDVLPVNMMKGAKLWGIDAASLAPAMRAAMQSNYTPHFPDQAVYRLSSGFYIRRRAKKLAGIHPWKTAGLSHQKVKRLIDWSDLTAAEKLEFDYLDSSDTRSTSDALFFRYMGRVYDTGEAVYLERPVGLYNGSYPESAWGGVVIRMNSDGETVNVAQYYPTND